MKSNPDYHNDMRRRSRASRPVVAIVFLAYSLGAAAQTGPGEVNASVVSPIVETDPVGPLTDVAYSSDGRYVAASSIDHNVYVWDAANGRLVHRLTGHTGEVYSVEFSKDGERLYSTAFDGRLVEWSNTQGDKRRSWDLGSWGISLAVVHETGDVLVGTADGRVVALLPADGVIETLLDDAPYGVASIAAWPDGGKYAYGVLKIEIRDRRDGTPPVHLDGHDFIVFSVVVSSDGETLVSGGSDGTVRFWSAAGGEPLRVVKTRFPTPFVDMAPDRRSVVIGGSGGRELVGGRAGQIPPEWRPYPVFLVDTTDDTSEPEKIGEHQSVVTGVRYSPDGNRVATVSLDGTLRIWDVSET